MCVCQMICVSSHPFHVCHPIHSNVTSNVSHALSIFNLHHAKSYERHEGAKVAQKGGRSARAYNESNDAKIDFLFISLRVGTARMVPTRKETQQHHSALHTMWVLWW